MNRLKPPQRQKVLEFQEVLHHRVSDRVAIDLLRRAKWSVTQACGLFYEGDGGGSSGVDRADAAAAVDVTWSDPRAERQRQRQRGRREPAQQPQQQRQLLSQHAPQRTAQLELVADSLFERYKSDGGGGGERAVIPPDGVAQLFDELHVDPMDMSALAFAWLCDCERTCTFTRDEFRRGAAAAVMLPPASPPSCASRSSSGDGGGCGGNDNHGAVPAAEVVASGSDEHDPRTADQMLRALAAAFPARVSARARRSADDFRDFYLFAFDYTLEQPARKALPLNDASVLWRMMLGEPGRMGVNRCFPLLDTFMVFLGTQRHGVSRDTWALVLDFARSVGDAPRDASGDVAAATTRTSSSPPSPPQQLRVDGEDAVLDAHDENAAWPVLIDEFVEYARAARQRSRSRPRPG